MPAKVFSVPVRSALTSVALLLGSVPASAQSPAPASTPNPGWTNKPGPALEAADAPGATGPSSADRAAIEDESIRQLSDELALPPVDDDMLAPPPQPEKVLTSWRQGLKQVKDLSTLLRSAYANQRAAEGRTRQAWAPSLPQLTGTGSIGHHLLLGEAAGIGGGGEEIAVPIIDPASTYVATIQLQQSVVNLSLWNKIGTAGSAERSAEYSAQDAERQVIGILSRAILGVITAERIAEISRVSLQSTLVNLKLTESRHQLGDATAVDVLRAQAQVDVTRAELIGSNELVRKSRETLGLALGEAEPWGLSERINFDTLWEDARSTCEKQSNVMHRSDLMAKTQDVHTAELALDDYTYAFIPSISFVGEMEYTDPIKRSLNQEHVTWSIGGLLTWNLYDGGLRYGAHTTNDGLLDAAQAQLTEARRQAIIEVERTQREVHVATSVLTVTTNARENQAKAAELARIAFIHGSGTAFILVDETRRLREAELNEAVKEFNLVTTQIEATLAISNCDL